MQIKNADRLSSLSPVTADSLWMRCTFSLAGFHVFMLHVVPFGAGGFCWQVEPARISNLKLNPQPGAGAPFPQR